jgi:hypothetical protein
MAPPQTHFNGTSAEIEALERALANNCECEYEKATERLLRRCVAHSMMLYDQRALDGLLFSRRMQERWLNEEWMVRDEPLPDE